MWHLVLSTLVFFLGLVLILFFLLRLLREHRPPSSTMAWGIVIVLLPHIGIPLYLLLGGRKVRSLQRRKDGLFQRGRRGPGGAPVELADPFVLEIGGMLEAAGLPPLRDGNRVEFIGSGETAYRRLMEMISGAAESIAVTTFILGKDPVGRAFLAELARKAQAGVEVRLLLDALGCFRTRWRFVDPLRRAGGRVGVFLPILPLRRKWSAHLRNHRKLVVVDRREAMVGGMNIARQYIGPDASASRWADACAVVRGPAVGDLLDIFRADWQFATEEEISLAPVPPENAAEAVSGGGLVQVVASGPDAEAIPLHDALLVALTMAKKRVWIVTPYFIPDESLAQIIKVMSRTGRDVRIVVPARSNHPVADLARGAFFRDLSGSNIRLFAYRPGMLHAKLIVIDDQVAFVGSVNMDVRSLYLNYELGVLIYDPARVREIADHIRAYMDASKELSWERDIRKNRLRETIEDVFRLFGPLL
jgi:cardiolipin synthase